MRVYAGVTIAELAAFLKVLELQLTFFLFFIISGYALRPGFRNLWPSLI